MFNKWCYISPFVSIFWTKRYVRYRPCGIRAKLRREKYKHRITKRPINLLIKETLKVKRRKLFINKSQRRNFNTDYHRMEIPIIGETNGNIRAIRINL